jgi:cytochrome c oxidase cbb3-type subunit III
MKRLVIPILFLLTSGSALAQSDSGQNNFWADPVNHPMMLVYLVYAFILVVIVLVGWVAIYLMKILNLITAQAEKEKADKLGIAYVPQPTWWSRFSQTMNASIPLEREQDIELDHNYDGIKELDNHLPPWWKYLFYGTIAWSVIYVVVFHFSDTLPLSIGEYEHEVAMAEEQARKLKASQPKAEINEDALAFSPDSTLFIANGKTVFLDNNCGSCHRNDGGGNSIGPNLTDEYWLHGGHIKDVFVTVKNGVVEKGMPAWGKSLSPQHVRDVTFFILSLQGTNPANAKKPQGEVSLKQDFIVTDSVKVQASL